MNKTYYRYAIYFVLIMLLAMGSGYIAGILPSGVTAGYSWSKKTEDQRDSLKVILLNKKAFNLRLTNPTGTVNISRGALNIARRVSYIPGMAEAYRVMGIGYFYQDKIQSAIENYIHALSYYTTLKDERNKAKVYNNIGNLYVDIGDPDNALKYFTRSLAIARYLKDEELTAGLYFNIGSVQEQKKRYKTALVFFDKSYEIFKRRQDNVYTTMYFQNAGLVHYKLRDFKRAKILLAKAIIEAKKHKLYKIITGCYLMLSGIYIQDRSYTEADKILREGLKYSNLLKDKELEHALQYKQYELQTATKNYAGAFELLRELFKHDSIQLVKKLSQNIRIASSHYLQQQRLQEKELIITQQKYREATFRWVLTLIILVFLVVAAVVSVLYFLRAKRRKEKELIIQNDITLLEQKALQAMMNPHFVFNVMTSIQHFINQADSKAANKILSDFARLARIHLEICMNSMITVHEELRYLELYLSLEKVRFSDRMEYQINIDENIDKDEIVIPSMLIQPFIENAIWHGIAPKNEGGLIKLNFDLDNTDLLVSVIDDGIGILNSGNSKARGHISRGMTLIRERVNLLNRLNERHIFIDQRQTGDCGTEVLIRIPA